MILSTAGALAQQAVDPYRSKSYFNHFDKLYRSDPRLVSGDFYQDQTPKSTDGHPFYEYDDWSQGYVIIGTVRFDSLLLRYDICTNKLVCNLININQTHLQIALKKEDVTSFSMNGKLFRPDPSAGTGKETRFCEVLATGPVTLLRFQSKNLKVSVSGITNYRYESASKLFLQVDDKVIRYKGKKTLFDLYPQYKVQLREYIHNERLRLSTKLPENHAKLTNYCNTLIIQSE